MIEQARETRIAAARAQLRQALGEMARAERAVHEALSDAADPAVEAGTTRVGERKSPHAMKRRI